MYYVSTRGYSAKSSFSDVLLEGLAPDGGLYLPEYYPKVNNIELAAWRELSYAELAYAILKKFISDIPEVDLKTLIYKTYTADIYKNTRVSKDAIKITPLRLLEDIHNKKLILQELSNGPTLAFKDIAMQLLGNLFEYVLDKNNAVLNIVGATSGDTGSAAEYAMRSKNGICVFMLSPFNKMSAFQTAQMFSLQDTNIFNLAITGVFDDCQDIIKIIANDLDFKIKYKIGTVNSINWARLVAQIVYYFYGYLNVTMNNDQKVSFTIPSGNFGNICAGHIARMMGLPIDKLIVATNENNILDEFFRTGVYRVRKSVEVYHTSSPSMDISKASNFERFIYDLLNRDSARVRTLFQKVEKFGGFDLSGKFGSDGNEFINIIRYGFVSGKSTHADRLKTIRFVKQKYGIIIDTHTADGIKIALDNLSSNTIMIVLETALPAKFNETIREALGQDADRPVGFESIETLPQRFQIMPVNSNIIKTFIANHTNFQEK